MIVSYVFTRLTSVSFPQVLTADGVPVKVDAVVFYRVVDPSLWVTRVKNGYAATHSLAQTTLRATLGAHTLTDVLTQRRGITVRMEVSLHPKHIFKFCTFSLVLPVVSCRRCCTLQPECGAFRWSGWSSRTWRFLSLCSAAWRQRRRLPGMPGLRYPPTPTHTICPSGAPRQLHFNRVTTKLRSVSELLLHLLHLITAG